MVVVIVVVVIVVLIIMKHSQHIGLLSMYQSHPFGTSKVGISITTENGHTDQANVPTAGGSSYTFNIPKNQGKWVQVCVNSGNAFHRQLSYI